VFTASKVPSKSYVQMPPESGEIILRSAQMFVASGGSGSNCPAWAGEKLDQQGNNSKPKAHGFRQTAWISRFIGVFETAGIISHATAHRSSKMSGAFI
jgi:hypothetical protein